MHRKGFNPDHVQPEDILCDFCSRAAWVQDIPCVEGHRGSLICGDCLRMAVQSLESDAPPMGTCDQETCVLCLRTPDAPMWQGSREAAAACVKCIKQAAGVLRKSKDWDWTA
jgi:hypothetical protein